VFANHSDALDLHLRSAVNEFYEADRKAGASPLRKLSGMMMIKNYQSVGWNATNVEFCYAFYSLHAIDPQFVHLMSKASSREPPGRAIMDSCTSREP
jgi:hypothetical protein